MRPAVMISFCAIAFTLVTVEVVALLETSDPFGALLATPVPQPISILYQSPVSPSEDVRPSSLNLNPLRPGIYETLPYAILLKVPGEAGDDCIQTYPEPLPRMPVQHPQMRLIPVKK